MSNSNISRADIESGVLWAFRLLLNREPDDPTAIQTMARSFSTPAEIRTSFINSVEYAHRFENCGRPRMPFASSVDLRDGVVWAYRLYFNQEPKNEDVSYQLNRVRTVEDIRTVFLLSREFELCKGYGLADLLDVEVLSKFGPFCTTPAPAGFFNDFLGSKTRLTSLPAVYASKSGSVEGGPNSATRGMHGISEWTGTLRSVLDAKDGVVAVELGAGWAPWLVAVAAAAKKRGLDKVELIGVEGSLEHVEFCRRHFLDNGLDPDAHRILHAVVGQEDGVARFPRLADPSHHYGASASFNEDTTQTDPGYAGWEEVKCISLKTLLKDVPKIDILHSDVQGAETSVLSAAMDLLNERLRRIVVGTHSRLIEAELFALFSSNGWILEYEQPCAIQQRADRAFDLVLDGEQIWRNAHFA